MDTLAKRLSSRRKSLGMSQAKLAAKAQLKQSDISKIEGGLVHSTPAMWRLARVLNCSPAWLEDGEDEGMPWGMGGATIPLAQAVETIRLALLPHSAAIRKTVADALRNLSEQPDETDFASAVAAALSIAPTRKQQSAA